MALPGAILSSPRLRETDEDGAVLPGAKLYAYEAGTVTPLDTFNDSDLAPGHENTNPVVADAGGLFGPIYLQPESYKFILKDADDNIIWTQDEVQDVGQVFLNTLGAYLAEGGKDQTSGYTILAADNFVSISDADGNDPAEVNLQPSADRGQDITIQNKTAVDLDVIPDGAETINAQAGAYTIPSGTAPDYPAITLAPIASGYLIRSTAFL